NVGLNAAKPTEGYQVSLWLRPGTTDQVVKAAFSSVDASRQGRAFLSGKVAGVSKDGKEITLEMPVGRDGETRRTAVKLTDKTALSFAYTGKDGARPTEGYHAEVWLDPDNRDVAARARFVDAEKEKAAMVSGKIVAVGMDSVTLEVPPAVRGEGPTR